MNWAGIIPSVDSLYFFVLIFSRIAATLVMLPVFGFQSVPIRFKVGLGVMISLMVITFLGPSKEAVTGGGFFVYALMSEATLGLALGFIVRIVVEAASLGASIVGFQMGFAVANVIDPQTGTQVSIVGTFQGLLAGMIFVTSGLHRFFLGGLINSFLAVPPGMAMIDTTMGDFIIQAGGQMFVTAIAVAAPVMVSLLIAKIALGIVARTVPQMNIFIVGMPLTIGLGLVLLGLSLPVMFKVTVGAFEWSGHMFESFIRAAVH